jgi:hypothetical protein
MSLTAPASIGQRLLWMIDRHRPATLSCPVLCRIRGPLDTGRLTDALDGLVRRHESLRTTLTGRGPGLTQVVHAERPLPLRIDDAAPDEIGPAIAAELRERLDPETAPVRATLWRTGPAEHTLCLNMHHLITDAWSCGVLLGDLRSGYAAGADRPESWTYRRFAAWQEAQLAGPPGRRQRDYWIRRLDGARPVPIPAPATPETSTGLAEATIPPPVATALREITRRTGTTLFTVLLAVFYARLAELTGARDLLAASLFANRHRPEVRHTVGFVANMVMLRTRVPDGGTFTDLLRATHATVMGAFAHQEMPFHLLPASLLTPDTGAGGPVRPDDLVFQLMTPPGEQGRAGALDFEMLVPTEIGTRFGLELTVVPVGDGLRALFFHARSRMDDAQARALVDGYAALAARAAAGQSLP